MTLLDKYLIRHTALATFVVCLVVTAVIWLTQALRLLELVIDRGAPLSMLLYMLLLTVPAFLALILPIGLSIAVLFVIYKLIMDSELVVMRAAGMSHSRLARPVLALAAAVLLIAYFLTLYVAPAANRELARQEFLAKNNYALVLLRDGAFNRLTDDITAYVRERVGLSEIRGLLLHDESKPEKTDTVIAEKGLLVETDEGSRIVLFNGFRQERDRLTGHVNELHFRQYTLDLSQFGPDYATRKKNPREKPTSELLSSEVLQGAGMEERRALAELHGRLALPWLTISYTVLALALLLSATVNRRGMVERLVLAAVGIILWQVAVLASVNFVPKDLRFVNVLYALIAVPLPYLFMALKRGRWV
ncbi:MAG: LPS export ABC transporter permease LptF [Bdellovibrionales bacterium]